MGDAGARHNTSPNSSTATSAQQAWLVALQRSTGVRHPPLIRLGRQKSFGRSSQVTATVDSATSARRSRDRCHGLGELARKEATHPVRQTGSLL